MTADYTLGFRILGGVESPRRLVDIGRALRGYATCLPEAAVAQESYLSAFYFGRDFQAHMQTKGTPGGFTGQCWSPWLWCDLDATGDDLDSVLGQTRCLVAIVLERFALDEDEVLIFFSGRKGFCVGLPTPADAEASQKFHRVARAFAEGLASRANARLDPATFVRVQPLRAPNSRHPRTGLHKVRLDVEELLSLKLERIKEMAREPKPFDWRERLCTHPQARVDWEEAVRGVEAPPIAVGRSTSAAGGPFPRLNRLTLDFIRNGAGEGDRHRLLFSAAANLAELGASFELAWALLSPAALDSGLPPAEVQRQIRCGLAYVLNRTESS